MVKRHRGPSAWQILTQPPGMLRKSPWNYKCWSCCQPAQAWSHQQLQRFGSRNHYHPSLIHTTTKMKTSARRPLLNNRQAVPKTAARIFWPETTPLLPGCGAQNEKPALVVFEDTHAQPETKRVLNVPPWNNKSGFGGICLARLSEQHHGPNQGSTFHMHFNSTYCSREIKLQKTHHSYAYENDAHSLEHGVMEKTCRCYIPSMSTETFFEPIWPEWNDDNS